MRAAIPVATALLCIGGCGPAAPDASGRHVDLYLDEGIEICGGEVARTDSLIERIYTTWTNEPIDDRRFDLHALADIEDGPCHTGGSGCWTNSDIWYDHQNDPDSMLAQANVRRLDGRSAPLFDHGVPIALATYNAFGYPKSQVAEFEATLLWNDAPDAYDQGKLGLVARYLIDRYGGTAMREYFHALAPADHRSQANVVAEFSNAFGEPLDAVWPDFRSTSRCAFAFRFCESGIPIGLPAEVDGIDCADPSTFGYSAPQLASETDRPYYPEQIFLLQQHDAERVSFAVSSGQLYVVACDACPAELWLGEAGPPFELNLRAGTYALVASDPEGDVGFEITAVP